jgi:tetratricopeptide (TPR) repeat protein
MRVPRFLSALIRRKTGEYESLDESTNPAQDCDAAHDELNMGHQPGLASLTDEERHQRLLTIIQDCAASQMSLWDQTDIDHLSSANPAKRAISYGRLAMFLKTRYRNTKASVLLETAIHLEREALALYRRACVPPPLFSLLDGFFSQANFHENLAVSLKMRFEATGSSGLLDDAIKLERAALRLSFKSRPHRARLCIRLAVSLSALFRLTGNRAIEDEAIELSREVLIEMCPVGHYARASVCGNLAELLRQRFVRTGESVFLDEATEWAREALDLRPEGHQDRAISCTHLAILLKHRFGQTGDRPLLYGAIRLERQVLSLSPPGHHSRAMACTNLAISLKQRFMETRETALLDEAIKLEQEALTLRPVGHPDRARSCGNLAVSMKQRFHQTKEYVLLYKTIDLEREALVLYPAGHPNRGRLCLNLANSLKSILTILSTDVEPLVLVELSALLDEALAHHPPGHPGRWRCLDQLTDLALLQYDHAAAVRHVQEILSAPTYDNINAVTESVAKMISRLANRITVSSSKTLNLLTLYGDAIGLFARAASFALDSSTQLRHARLGRTLGSGAFMFAARANELSSGLELLERARGVIWAQALHTREYMQGQVAGELIKPLPDLVRAVPSEGPYRNDEISARNQMYAKRGQMHRVVRSIRTLPGHNDFMRGPSVQALLNTAARNTVVVLVADHSECHALIIPSNNHPFIDVAIPGMNERSIQSMGFTNLVAQGRGRATNGDKIERGVRLVKGMSPSYVRLGKLWTIIVKPIINRLGLSVSSFLSS